MDDTVAKAETALRDWLAVRGAVTLPLFVSLSKRSMNKWLGLRALRGLVTGTMKAASVVGNKSPHSLRHTAITKAVSSGQPLERVMLMAGHANPATTLIYYHEENRVKDPVEAYINQATKPAFPSGLVKGKAGQAMACLNNLVLGILLVKRNTAQSLLLAVTSPPIRLRRLTCSCNFNNTQATRIKKILHRRSSLLIRRYGIVKSLNGCYHCG